MGSTSEQAHICDGILQNLKNVILLYFFFTQISNLIDVEIVHIPLISSQHLFYSGCKEILTSEKSSSSLVFFFFYAFLSNSFLLLNFVKIFILVPRNKRR